MQILYIIIGASISALVVWLIASQLFTRKSATIQAQLQHALMTIEQHTLRMSTLENTLTATQKELADKDRLLAITETKLTQQDKLLSEKQVELQQLNDKLTKEFENIANRVLESKTNNLSNTHQKWMDNILNPLKAQIDKFEKRVNDTHTESVNLNSALKTKIEELNKQSTEISKEAHNLANALKGSVKAQGDWGELILEKILERSGLERDKEFMVQASFTAEDGRRLQPDVVVLLPENKSVVIDSKVSLLAYEQYASTEDETLRQQYLKKHILDIRNHIKGLSEKKYQQLYQLNTVDFVIMFMPIEPAFTLAMQHDNNLWTEAYEKNIVIVSTSTLLATLRTISMMWRQDRMNKNALEIARQSGALYDKFAGFVNDMIDMGKKMQGAQDAYSAAMNKLSTGNGNIVKRLEDIRKLGANSSKQLPQSLIDRSEA
jgi:DNA recombination protein RmuC